MNVIGLILSILLLIVLAFFGYKQIKGIIEGVKMRKEQKLKKAEEELKENEEIKQ